MNRAEQKRRQRESLKKVRRRRKLISFVFLLVILGGISSLIYLLRPQIELIGESQTELAIHQIMGLLIFR